MWKALRWLAVSLLMAVLAACTSKSAPAPTSVPEASPEATVAVPMTPTRMISPSATPSPTSLPTFTPTPTPLPSPPLTQTLLPPDWLARLDLGGPRPGMVFSVGKGMVLSAALRASSPRLALGTFTGVYLCDFPTDPAGGGEIACSHFLPHPSWVAALAFSPDGSRLFTLDNAETLRTWDLTQDPPQAQVLGTSEESYQGAAHLAVSADGRYLAVTDYHVEVWDLQNPERRFRARTPEKPFFFAAFLPGTQTLLASTYEGGVYALDVQDPEAGWKQWRAPQETVETLALDVLPQDGQWALVLRDAGDERKVHVEVWEGEALQRRIAFPEEELAPMLVSLHFSRNFIRPHLTAPGPEGGLVVGTGWHSLYLYRPGEQEPAGVFQPDRSRLQRRMLLAGYDAASDQVVAVWTDGTIATWDASTGQRTGYRLDLTYPVEGLGFDVYGRGLYAMQHHIPVIFSLRRQLRTAGAYIGARTVAVAATGCHLVYGGFTDFPYEPVVSTLCYLHPRAEDINDFPEFESLVPPVSLPATGGFAMVNYETEDLEIWDLYTGERVHLLDRTGLGPVFSLAASPDGLRLYGGADRSRIGVWDTRTGQRLEVLSLEAKLLPDADPEYDARIEGLAVSPDGRLLAVARGDGILALRDLGEGRWLWAEPFTTFTGGSTDLTLNWMAFSHDGRYLFGRSEYGDEIFILNLEKKTALPGLPVAPSSVRVPAALSPDGRLLAYGDEEGSILVYDVAARLAEDGLEDLLPLPVPPELAYALSSYRSRYTVTLNSQGEARTLLDVTQEGRHDPTRFHLTVAGQGWHVTGEAYASAAEPIPRFKPEGQAWQMAFPGDLPPTAPLLRPWPWQYQGADQGLHRYTSTDPQAAVPLHPAWLRQALGVQAAYFSPETFQGEVVLTSQGVLQEARLTWEGALYLDGETQPARVEVVYQAWDFDAADVEVVGPEGAVSGTPAPEATEAASFSVDEATGIPLPPGTVSAGEPGVYQVNQAKEEVIAWYQAVLEEQGFVIQSEGERTVMGITIYTFTVSKESRVFDIVIAGQMSITVIGVEER